MMILKRIDPISAGKALGALYALMGLIIGGIMSLVAILGAGGGGQGAGATLFGVGAVIILPIFYGIMGFISGAIGAALYNFVASQVGGIEFEFAGLQRDYQE